MSLLLAAVGAWIVLSNIHAYYLSYLARKPDAQGEHRSVTPLVGGAVILLALLVFSTQWLRHGWFVPLLIDPGCVPLAATTCIMLLPQGWVLHKLKTNASVHTALVLGIILMLINPDWAAIVSHPLLFDTYKEHFNSRAIIAFVLVALGVLGLFTAEDRSEGVRALGRLLQKKIIDVAAFEKMRAHILAAGRADVTDVVQWFLDQAESQGDNVQELRYVLEQWQRRPRPSRQAILPRRTLEKHRSEGGPGPSPPDASS